MNQLESHKQTQDYRRVEQAIEYLARNFRDQPTLDEMAASVHLSKFHFQRLFRRWAGITPTQFVQYLTLGYAKERLREASTLLDTALDAGLSGPSRLHDLFVTFEAVTPGEYKNEGAGLEIAFGFHGTPFGECLLAVTGRGICALRFLPQPGRRDETMVEIRSEWPEATYQERKDLTSTLVRRIFASPSSAEKSPLHLLLRGTNFQIQVWQALLKIPPGDLVSYQQLAGLVGNANSTRAVAGAVAKNPVAYVIPCHRVISKTGQAHQYRWGATRKKAMLAWEAKYASTLLPPGSRIAAA